MPEELSFMAQITQRKEDERNRLLEEAAEAPLQRPVEFTGLTTREQLVEEQTKSVDALFGAVAEGIGIRRTYFIVGFIALGLLIALNRWTAERPQPSKNIHDTG
ncbi:hypothetical protein LCGC14_2211230 [marine sediment metagenome]|uniref:Uncharacterized protein n=1 Tax=marine sediment metagenome TaxID=412755 RepID=A0A0F9DDN3_9ZZZZ